MSVLAGQTAVVTGAGSGIGKAIALALAACRTDLLLIGRRPAPLELTAEEVRASGSTACVLPGDLSSVDGIRLLLRAVHQTCDRLDILVHSAATMTPGLLAEARGQDLDVMYRTNVLGPSLLTQGLLSQIRQRQGQIVFINSSAGLAARPSVGQYAATKHALKAIADSLREEVNADGVRVLSVYPGRTATPLQERLHSLEGRPYRPERLLQPQDVASVVVTSLCLPPTAEVTDINIRPLAKPEHPAPGQACGA
jgi:NAD(P)-dependent dehydrogenase (short-subunit alcohol dehydrogenase family)